eukprot:jgi/Picsp_1/3657/NSC_06494-R1_---NA---
MMQKKCNPDFLERLESDKVGMAATCGYCTVADTSDLKLNPGNNRDVERSVKAERCHSKGCFGSLGEGMMIKGFVITGIDDHQPADFERIHPLYVPRAPARCPQWPIADTDDPLLSRGATLAFLLLVL